MDKDTKEIQAVHERDLENLLNKLSLRDNFDAGKIKCKFCEDTITKDNLYSLISESSVINFICDKPQCIADFMAHMETKKSNGSD